MKFTQHQDSNVFTVKYYEAGLVKVNNLTFNKSCFITQFSTEANWHCNAISNLTIKLIDQILLTKPDVLILGTGNKQIFPEPHLFAYCASKGVGLEVMANDAACRTYNVLAFEDREVSLALIIT